MYAETLNIDNYIWNIPVKFTNAEQAFLVNALQRCELEMCDHSIHKTLVEMFNQNYNDFELSPNAIKFIIFITKCELEFEYSWEMHEIIWKLENICPPERLENAF